MEHGATERLKPWYRNSSLCHSDIDHYDLLLQKRRENVNSWYDLCRLDPFFIGVSILYVCRARSLAEITSLLNDDAPPFVSIEEGVRNALKELDDDDLNRCKEDIVHFFNKYCIDAIALQQIKDQKFCSVFLDEKMHIIKSPHPREDAKRGLRIKLNVLLKKLKAEGSQKQPIRRKRKFAAEMLLGPQGLMFHFLAKQT